MDLDGGRKLVWRVSYFCLTENADTLRDIVARSAEEAVALLAQGKETPISAEAKFSYSLLTHEFFSEHFNPYTENGLPRVFHFSDPKSHAYLLNVPNTHIFSVVMRHNLRLLTKGYQNNNLGCVVSQVPWTANTAEFFLFDI